MAEYGFLAEDKTFATRAINTTCFDSKQRKFSSVVITPSTLDTDRTQSGSKKPLEYTCSRGDNSTPEQLQEMIASLENARYCLSFSSGLGVVMAIARLLKVGDHCLYMGDQYSDVGKIFDALLPESGIERDIIGDLSNNDVIHKSVKNQTKMLWIETPTNPLVTYVDIAEACKIAHKYNLIVVVDNTFLSPYLQKPLALGADIVMHLTTKYCNGHSSGVMIGTAVTNDEEIYGRLKYFQNAFGVIPSPFDCYPVIRSLKTLKVRMTEQMRSSLKIAQFLEKHPLVESVLHPALESHPGHKIAKKQSSGWSGMLAFYVEGGLDESTTLLSNLKLFTVTGTLKDYESFIEVPFVTTHASLPLEEKFRLGITDNLLRMSVGLENADDLIDDLRRAFDIFSDVTKL